ncbi:MAG: hypothetical protein KC636_23110 [Myxococcales bacterium]|nr:hypothetical protein [Myxococcales bacterium]
MTGWSRTNQLILDAAARLGCAGEALADVHSDFFVRLRSPERAVIVSKTRSPFLTEVAQALSGNKYVSRALLAARGIPVVPAIVDDADQTVACAREALARFGRVLVKPNWGNRGVGISGPHEQLDAVVRACAWARSLDRDDEALLEPYLDGDSLRLTVIGGRFVAAAELTRPVLLGGASPRAQVQAMNRDPHRGDPERDADRGLDTIIPEENIEGLLAVHGLTLDAPAPGGARIEILSEEASIVDRTDEIHDDWRRLAERACGLLGVDVGGVDLRGPLATVRRPIVAKSDTVVLEVNVSPALHLHALPTHGVARPVYEAFVAYCLSLPGAPEPRAVVEV